jgi:hypothetical protein
MAVKVEVEEATRVEGGGGWRSEEGRWRDEGKKVEGTVRPVRIDKSIAFLRRSRDREGGWKEERVARS